MSEYIRRQDALVSIRQYQYPYGVEFLINNLPAADVAVVKHGKWISLSHDHNDVYCRCSECGKAKAGRTNYCPNCGARMDKEE